MDFLFAKEEPKVKHGPMDDIFANFHVKSHDNDNVHTNIMQPNQHNRNNYCSVGKGHMDHMQNGMPMSNNMPFHVINHNYNMNIYNNPVNQTLNVQHFGMPQNMPQEQITLEVKAPTKLSQTQS